MKKYAVITSMNLDYYNHCGKLMANSCVRNFNVGDFYIYNEDFNPKTKGAITLGWNLGDQYKEFYDHWRKVNKRTAIFAKKAFSIIHAMEHLDCDRIIWVDADSQFTAPMNKQLLDLISPDDTLSTHFGVVHEVDEKKFFSCETGFFILNKNHPDFKQFHRIYKQIYVNNETANLRRFYDGEVYGETVRRLQEHGIKMLDLNPGQKHKTPIPRSVLAPYISHYKAGLKDTIDFDSELEKFEQDEIQSI